MEEGVILTPNKLASILYEGILSGKLDYSDTLNIVVGLIDPTLSDEVQLIEGILSKTIGFLLEHKENEGVYIKMNDKNWICYFLNDQIHIQEYKEERAMEDGSRLTVLNCGRRS